MNEGSQNSTPIYAEMKRRLAEVRARFYRERLLYGFVLTATILIGSIGCLSVAEALLNGTTTLRTILFFAGFFFILTFAFWFLVVPLLRWSGLFQSISEKECAVRVGEKFPQIKDRLRNILEIFEEQENDEEASLRFHPEYSPELIDASFGDLHKAASGLTFADVVTYEPASTAAKRLSLVLAAVVLLFVVPQFNLQFAAFRFVHFRTDFRLPQPFMILVQPGNVEIVKGESVPVTISLLANSGGAADVQLSMPRSIAISYHQAGISSQENLEVKIDSSGQFRATLASIKQSTNYYAEADDIISATYTITVVDRPVVRSLKVRVTPPPYSHLPEQSLDENIGDVAALPGTVIRWQITPSKEVQRAELVLNSGKKIALSRRGSDFFGQQILRERATYHVELEDTEQFTNIDPIEYKLDPIVDGYPTVAIVYPGKNIDVAGELQIPLRLKIHDDFGFTSLTIAYRLVHSQYEKSKEEFSLINVPLVTEEKNSVDAEVGFQWDASSLGLVPEDVIEYHAEVLDNDDVSGPKKGISESFLLRLPSLDEVFADADKNQNDAIQKLGNSLEEEQELKKGLDELSQSLKQNQPLDWQQQKKAEETLKRYQELTKKVDDVSKSVDAMTQEMQKNNILSSETLQKYTELQQLLQQIDSPEFRDAMKKMQDAMQNVSPDQLRQAMQQVQFSEEVFRQSIERTMELLKRIQVEQKMDEMVKRANALQQQQDSLMKETDGSKQSDPQKQEDLARKQDDINKQLGELQKQLDELGKKMGELSPKEMPMKELEKAEQAAHDSTMEQSMQQSSKQLRAQHLQQALQAQKQASKSMQQMSQQLSEMQEQMLSNAMNETMNVLRKTMNDLLEVSQQEETLKNQSQSLDPNSQQFRENAQKQLGLQADLSTIANNLMELSQKSFAVTPEMGRAVGKAMGNMGQAMNGLEQRNGSSASMQQGEAMASLNKAASLTQSSMDAMQQGGGQSGGGSLLQQLRRMSGQQQSINMQTEQVGQSQGMSQQQLQETGRLAQQQDAVRKSLEELNKEAQENPEKNRIMGDLQKIADEMKEVVENLQQNHVNPNTIQQQQRILSRLLNAQTSMHERDFEQRRTSTAGTTPVRRSPAEVQEESAQSDLRRDLLKAIDEGYSKDYQDLIRKYYDALDKSK